MGLSCKKQTGKFKSIMRKMENELEKYWDDAYDIEYTSCDEITYTDRFPKPEWIK